VSDFNLERCKLSQQGLGRAPAEIGFWCILALKILRLKCTKIQFQLALCPDLAERAYSAPPGPLAGFKGPTSKGGEWKGTDGTGWEWKEREGRDESVVESKNFLKIHPG